MIYRVEDLPASPLEASALFHRRDLPKVLDALGAGTEALTLVFPQADHTHRGWRLAVVQGLAREHAPARVNGVGGGENAIAATHSYCLGAPGVTGQYWPLDATGVEGA